MSITVRQLMGIEYIRLKDIEEGFVPKPEASLVVIAEDENGEICGRLMLLPILHLDGIWIREDLRDNLKGGRAAVRIEKEMMRILEEAQITGVQVDVYKPELESYLSRMGYRKEKIISVFRKEIRNGNRNGGDHSG